MLHDFCSCDTFEYIICSNILVHIQVSEIGLKFQGSVRLPFLKTGTTVASFQTSISTPPFCQWLLERLQVIFNSIVHQLQAIKYSVDNVKHLCIDTRFTRKSQHNILTKLFTSQVNNLTILQYIVTVLKVTFYYYTKEIY